VFDFNDECKFIKNQNSVVIKEICSIGCHLFCVYRVAQKSKLLILSKYVNKTEKIGGMRTNTKSYRENEVLADIFM